MKRLAEIVKDERVVEGALFNKALELVRIDNAIEKVQPFNFEYPGFIKESRMPLLSSKKLRDLIGELEAKFHKYLEVQTDTVDPLTYLIAQAVIDSRAKARGNLAFNEVARGFADEAEDLMLCHVAVGLDVEVSIESSEGKKQLDEFIEEVYTTRVSTNYHAYKDLIYLATANLIFTAEQKVRLEGILRTAEFTLPEKVRGNLIQATEEHMVRLEHYADEVLGSITQEGITAVFDHFDYCD